jgi:heat shock protein HslJ
MSKDVSMLRSIALLALAGSLVLVSCGDDDEDGDDAASSVTAADLDGRAFVSTSVEGHDLVEGSTVTLSFEADNLAAQAGCNSMTGGYTVEDGALTVGALAATMMACEEPLMSQEQWLASFLEDDPAIALDGDVLTLTEGDVTMTLTAQG